MKLTPKKFALTYSEVGSLRGAAKRLGIRYHEAWALYRAALADGLVEKRPCKTRTRDKEMATPPLPSGHVRALGAREMTLPEAGEVKRYIFTCAQNNTRLHEPLWRNLKALARHHCAEIHVSRFLYIKHGLGAHGDKAETVKRGAMMDQSVEWPKEIVPHLSDERMEVAPGLVWCGEMNILPTAVRPLSGMESYTGRKSGIFPHVKLAMESVPSAKHEAAKLNYTTGTVTLRNYIERKAGLKAMFHHSYGALLVEVNSDGNWFCRQLNADSEGTIYDLNLRVQNSRVSAGHRVEAITWGDIHAQRVDPTVRELGWGEGGMLDVLRPRYQFIHDLFDFTSRNGHDRYDHHKRFQRYREGGGHDSVAEELMNTADFLRVTQRPWCETVVVESNHDNMLERWLRDDPGWYAKDPVNAVTFLELQLEKYRALERGDDSFLLIRDALETYGGAVLSDFQFLAEDESFIICHDANGGIECGMHGHLGPNGARGGANAFARMGRKAITGHSHSACIHDGIYVAGTSSLLDLGYNKGPSSWSHTHVVTYPNGKRAVITMFAGKWRA